MKTKAPTDKGRQARSARADDAKRGALLDAALQVFLRFGFRKTSMDEVARAAGISRQGLYLHFDTKEALFAATIERALGEMMSATQQALQDETLDLEVRLLRAFDAWMGRFVGITNSDTADLSEALRAQFGERAAQADAQFVHEVAKVIKDAGLSERYRHVPLSARQIAETLHAAARGLKHSAATREQFIKQLALAVKMACAPLRGKR